MIIQLFPLISGHMFPGKIVRFFENESVDYFPRDYLHVLVPSLLTAFLQFLQSTPRFFLIMDLNESSSLGKRRHQDPGRAASFKIKFPGASSRKESLQENF